MLDSSPIRKTLAISGGVLLCLAMLFAQLDLHRGWTQNRNDTFEDLEFPSGRFLRLASLNHRALAADLAWIAIVVNHGDVVEARNRASRQLLHNARVVTNLDPYFYRVYEWTPGAFLNRRFPVSAEDLEKVNDLMDQGIQNFPLDADLRLSAALNYVGYGKGFSDQVRVRQSERAIAYLNEAVHAPNATEEVPAVLAWFKHRKRRFAHDDVSPDEQRRREIDFYVELLNSTTDTRLRELALKKLRALGAQNREVMEKSRAQIEVLERARKQDLAFVPPELWLELVPEDLDG